MLMLSFVSLYFFVKRLIKVQPHSVYMCMYCIYMLDLKDGCGFFIKKLFKLKRIFFSVMYRTYMSVLCMLSNQVMLKTHNNFFIKRTKYLMLPIIFVVNGVVRVIVFSLLAAALSTYLVIL